MSRIRSTFIGVRILANIPTALAPALAPALLWVEQFRMFHHNLCVEWLAWLVLVSVRANWNDILVLEDVHDRWNTFHFFHAVVPTLDDPHLQVKKKWKLERAPAKEGILQVRKHLGPMVSLCTLPHPSIDRWVVCSDQYLLWSLVISVSQRHPSHLSFNSE